MKREIKFRGKRATGMWAYGNLIEMPKEYIKGCWQRQYGICLPENEKIIKVDSATVGQFTGLLDKNGKEIYEGEIITIKDYKEEKYVRKIIKYIPKKAAFCAANITELHFTAWEVWHPITQKYINELNFEVIGNIHDNPELLTQK